jgi:hypothetical protein
VRTVPEGRQAASGTLFADPPTEPG